MAGHDVVDEGCCQYRYELAASRAKARGMGRKPHKKGAPWRSFLRRDSRHRLQTEVADQLVQLAGELLQAAA